MKAILLSIVALAGFASVSCNTMVGLGRDTRILGAEMEKTAGKTIGGGESSDSGYDTGGAPVY
jgi:predicted small secreted protein